LVIPPNWADEQPPEGYQIIPTERAHNLVAYLDSLRLDYDVPESKRPE
jgi:hypothetical protein